MTSSNRFVAAAENYIGRLEMLTTRQEILSERIARTGASPETLNEVRRFLDELQTELNQAWDVRNTALARCYNSN